ncbi:carboxypeptidase A4 in complex with A cleaved hexapeptide, partial [Neoconidiobolus thromboides FSU 785]
FVDSYHSISEINSWLDTIASSSGGAATVSSIGTTYEGRPIKAITFRKPNSSPKKSIVYHGGIHAREWISPATLVTLIDSFSKYSSDAEISSLLDTFEYTFIPVVNVDGYEYTRNGDRLWRKNRQPNGGNQCIGTDTNRNWGYQWQGSSDVCGEAYPGPRAFSAPEPKAVADFITRKGNVVSYIDFHSYGQLFMSPYGFTCNQNPADFAAQDAAAKQANAALRAVNGRSYKQGTICKTIYQAYGSSVDWAYSVAKVKYPFAIELPDTGAYGFALPASYIPSTGQEILAAV